MSPRDGAQEPNLLDQPPDLAYLEYVRDVRMSPEIRYRIEGSVQDRSPSKTTSRTGSSELLK
jgi:hypothetical protein